MKFVHLHCHSYYSFLDGTASPEALVEKAKEMGMKGLAITDINGLYGALPFYKAAVKCGLKPVFGAEIVKERERAVLLARNSGGFSELCRLVTGRHLDHHFNLVNALSDLSENVIVILDDDLLVLRLLKKRVPKNLYIGITPFRDEKSRRRTKKLLALSREKLIPVAASCDVHFAERDDFTLHKILRAVGTNTTVDTLPEDSTANPESWLRDPREMREMFREIPDAIENNLKIAEQCNFQFKLGKWRFPQFQIPEGETPYSFLYKVCLKSMAGKYKPLTREVTERLNYELEIIDRLGFSEYFLIVWDIVQHARGKGIPTIGKGSAAGSIVSYLLDITPVDPVKYNLYFERFLNPERLDPPDIDLDICWKRRDEVLQYVYEKYGEDRVAMVCTFNCFNTKSAVREVGKALGMADSEITKITTRIPHFFEGSLKEAVRSIPECRGIPIHQEPYSTIFPIADKILGFPRHLGVHPGGIVISPFHLPKAVPLQKAAKGVIITQYDMGPIEQLGLVKIDLLGQRSLSVIADVRRVIKERYGFDFDPGVIPKPDKKTRDLLKSGNTMGCFQIESP
ncbi:MAG: PHP domain-containing protein, partial [Fidelibacterota bacterium]